MKAAYDRFMEERPPEEPGVTTPTTVRRERLKLKRRLISATEERAGEAGAERQHRTRDRAGGLSMADLERTIIQISRDTGAIVPAPP